MSLAKQTPTKSDIELLFAMGDSNKDGYLTLKEMSDLFTSLGSPVSQSELQFLVLLIDSDKDGKLSLAEMNSLVTLLSKQQLASPRVHCASTSEKEGKIDMVFELFDEDHDRSLSKSELTRFLNLLYEGEGLTPEELEVVVEQLIINLDTDDDSGVSAEELFNAIR
jgi:calcium-binding protein CML